MKLKILSTAVVTLVAVSALAQRQRGGMQMAPADGARGAATGANQAALNAARSIPGAAGQAFANVIQAGRVPSASAIALAAASSAAPYAAAVAASFGESLGKVTGPVSGEIPAARLTALGPMEKLGEVVALTLRKDLLDGSRATEVKGAGEKLKTMSENMQGLLPDNGSATHAQVVQAAYSSMLAVASTAAKGHQAGGLKLVAAVVDGKDQPYTDTAQQEDALTRFYNAIKTACFGVNAAG